MSGAICQDRHVDTVAIVTGSTHGIGLGIARRFVAEGASVVVNDQGRYDGHRIAHALADDGDGEATYVRADVTDVADVRSLVETTVDEYGRVDALVNNVGGAGVNGDPATLAMEDWEVAVNTTLRSQWLCTKHAIEHLPEGGSVVNVSSVHGERTTPGSFPYNVAKSGVNGLTRALAVELADVDVRVNAVLPGAIEIDDPDADESALRERNDTDPVGRLGTPADVAGLVAFLASDDARFVTGETIRVDGGRGALQPTTRYGR